VPPSTANGIAINTSGNVGIGTTAPISKLHAETSQANTTAVYGNAMGANGVGVYARSTSGPAVYAEGNAVQLRDKGGFAKAMAYIDPFLPAAQYVVRSFNSQGAAITVSRLGPGTYVIDFGFKVDDRFISLTAQADTPGGEHFSIMIGTITAVSGSRAYVQYLRNNIDNNLLEDARFHIIVF
jgi:hypothetical protein